MKSQIIFTFTQKSIIQYHESNIGANKKINEKIDVNIKLNKKMDRKLNENIDKNYIINGNTLTYRPSERSKHKFKFRITQKINLKYLQLFINSED